MLSRILKLRIDLIFLTLLVGVIVLIGGCNMAAQSSVAQPADQVSTPPPDITCDQLVTLAETTVGLVCDGISRNQVCYGNHLVSVEFQPNSNVNFVQSGDKVDLLSVRRLSTSPLNLQTRDWGIAVVKAQANLPDSLPGQNVTFLLYGDTTVDNPSPDMHAVTVSTRIGTTNCTDVPDSAVLIQAPSGSQVAMNINGADVTLGSTAYITAQQGQEMDFAIIEGMGVIASNGVVQVVQPGAQVRIPLGGADGLQSSGPPSPPEPFDLAAIQIAPIRLLDRPITIPQPIQPGQVSPNTSTPSPAPQAVATTCAPRTDWTYHYTVQSGDYLSTIALKLNMRTADLQAGNCIADPNRLVVGQSLLVPRPVPTNTPPPPTATPIPTDTPTITPTPTELQMTGPNLRADSDTINAGECTYIRWDTDNVKAVYFEGQPVQDHDARQVCPTSTTTYTLLVQTLDGKRVTFQITITVNFIIG